MTEILVETIAEEMYQMVAECDGKKNLKPGDLIKAMTAKHGEACSKELSKLAIRQLIESSRCVYAYLGGTFIQLPKAESAQA
jgi:hypothetical protein